MYNWSTFCSWIKWQYVALKNGNLKVSENGNQAEVNWNTCFLIII